MNETEETARVDAMRDMVEADPNYDLRCIVGGEKVFYVVDTAARIAGHIYSPKGHAVYRISRCCEFHYDRLAEDEDDG